MRCRRSVDIVAMLVGDLRSAETLRPLAALESLSALASAFLTTGRYTGGGVLAEHAVEAEAPHGARLHRLALAAMRLGNDALRPESSQVYDRARIPRDDEAPIVAFEALVAGDATAAYRAIDEFAVKQTIGLRLRLLAGAAGTDLPEAKERAEKVCSAASPDPGLRGDAQCVLALPSGRELPREILVERLRDAMGDAVRFVGTH